MIQEKLGPRIAFHGGHCCGIKIIHCLGGYPDKLAPPLVGKQSGVDLEADQYGRTVSSDWNVFPGGAPEETYAERVQRYIKWLDSPTGRPNGIIEITLAQDIDAEYPDPDQLPRWTPLLLDWGFKEVTSCYNSNSGSRVHVFHRTTDLNQ